MVHITLSGRVPSKKNSKRMFKNKRTGAPILVPSRSHNEWHEEVSWQINSWKNTQPASVRNHLPFRKSVEMSMYFYPPDSKKGDLTNKAESVMDLLVDMGVLEDDNWEIVPFLALNFGGVDKHNPRVEIKIV